MKSKKDQVTLYIYFFLTASIIIVLAAVLAPIGVLSNTKMFQAGEATLAGGAGFLSAGLLGGAIGVSQVKGKSNTSKVLETIGFTLDPLEKPSDILTGTT